MHQLVAAGDPLELLVRREGMEAVLAASASGGSRGVGSSGQAPGAQVLLHSDRGSNCGWAVRADGSLVCTLAAEQDGGGLAGVLTEEGLCAPAPRQGRELVHYAGVGWEHEALLQDWPIAGSSFCAHGPANSFHKPTTFFVGGGGIGGRLVGGGGFLGGGGVKGVGGGGGRW